MARKRLLTAQPGQRLLQSKLQILTGSGGRRPSVALSILTGGLPEPRPAHETLEPLAFSRPALRLAGTEPEPGRGTRRTVRARYTARTVYLSEQNLADLDAIIGAWQTSASRPGPSSSWATTARPPRSSVAPRSIRRTRWPKLARRSVTNSGTSARGR